jgi:hypothetical protein
MPMANPFFGNVFQNCSTAFTIPTEFFLGIMNLFYLLSAAFRTKN